MAATIPADGKTDVTAQLQEALSALEPAGGTLRLPSGQYLLSGGIRIPAGVTLQGETDSPQHIQPLKGTVILATGGRDTEEGPALFEMGDSSAVRGVTIFYPEQKPTVIRPYPWTFHLFGGDNTVENVTLINSYNGIRIGPDNNVRHRIRSVVGCVLRRGIYVDYCTDIGRIENVQFHCHWWSSPEVGGDWGPVFDYMWRNLEAFVFGRTDWEYVTNTFVFPVKTGYRFIAADKGAMNGQLLGVGADAAQRCVVVERIQPMGLLFTNGQFVAFNGDDPIQVEIAETAAGSVRFVNCAFWGPAYQNVVNRGNVFLSLSDCYLSSWHPDNKGRPLIEMLNGKLQVRGCSFATPQPSVHIKEGTRHAIISDNNGGDGVRIINDIGDRAILRDNEPVSNGSETPAAG